MQDFGTWLAAQRNSRKLNQTRAAKLLGVTRRTIAGWELGERRPPDGTVERIASQFGEDVERIFARLDGLPLPEPKSKSSVVIEASRETVNRITALASAAGMSAGEWLDELAGVMDMSVGDYLTQRIVAASADRAPGDRSKGRNGSRKRRQPAVILEGSNQERVE